MLELMITVAIICIVLSLAIVTLTGYLPKQRLITTQGLLADLFQRAQTEANARSYWTCVWFDKNATPPTAQIFADTDTTNHGSGNAACDRQTDTPLTKIAFKDDVDLATGGGCTYNITKDCVIWFDTTGAPKLCKGYSTCGGTAPNSGCIDFSYQIVISTSKLATGTRAREVEALAGGLVQAVKPLDKGLATPMMWANSAQNPNGCE